MRIQLIHPPTHVAPGNLQTPRPTQPLGLAYVAAALRNAGHDCVVLDAIGEAPTQMGPAGTLVRLGLTDDEILARVDPSAAALGITNMFSFNWPALRSLIDAIGARYPDKIIVCGGEHFTALPELSMRTAPIDYIVMGEGEGVATELFAKLGSGTPFDAAQIKGICWRRGEEIVKNPRAERTRAVDEIPWPAWDLFDMDSYNRHDLVGGLRFGDRTMPILATRGCPYQCTYCASPQMWTTRWYARDPVDVANEIEFYAQRYHANNFPFQDLTMIVKKDWVVRFCNEIMRRGLDIRWQLPTGTRCEVVDDEVAALLWRSGCRWLCYAPESGSDRTRELIKKKLKMSSLLQAVAASVRANLQLQAYMVIGFPHDTRDDLNDTLKLARRLARMGVEDIAVNFFFPVPSTELWTYLQDKGRLDLSDEALTAPAFGHTKTLKPARHYCEHVSCEELTRWKYRIVANFYLTAWLWHPRRVFRIAHNAMKGKQTTALEKFLSDSKLRLARKLGWKSGPHGAQRSGTGPVLPY